MKLKFAVLATWLLAGGLVSCADSSLDLAEGGMSGTGISVGAITGFGSVYVNGIHFNVDQATFYRDGSAVDSQDNYSLGELVTVTGSISVDGNNGNATVVEFESLVRGVITQPSTDGNRVEVMGQTVGTDRLTVLQGASALTGLALGDLVEISGVPDAEGNIQASSIRLLVADQGTGTQPLEVKGSIAQLSTAEQRFTLGQLSVDYRQATLPDTPLSNGLQVRVETDSAVMNRVVQASSIRLVDRRHYLADSNVRLEGLVTKLESVSRFQIAGQQVVTTSATRFRNLDSAGIRLNDNLEVDGIVNTAGELEATEVKRGRAWHDGDDDDQHLNGILEAIDLVARTVQVAGQLLHIDNASMLLTETAGRHQTLRLEELRIGDAVWIEFTTESDGTLRVLRLETGDHRRFSVH